MAIMQFLANFQFIHFESLLLILFSIIFFVALSDDLIIF